MRKGHCAGKVTRSRDKYSAINAIVGNNAPQRCDSFEAYRAGWRIPLGLYIGEGVALRAALKQFDIDTSISRTRAYLRLKAQTLKNSIEQDFEFAVVKVIQPVGVSMEILIQLGIQVAEILDDQAAHPLPVKYSS